MVSSGAASPAPVQELRDLTRTRKQLVREITQHTLRIQKTLENANLKLTGLLSNILGVSGRAILQALVVGETDPERLANLVHLTQVDALEQAVREVEARLGHALVSFRTALDRLIAMPGVSETVARVLVAEIGFDMTRFPTAGHLVSITGISAPTTSTAGTKPSSRIVSSKPSGTRPHRRSSGGVTHLTFLSRRTRSCGQVGQIDAPGSCESA